MLPILLILLIVTEGQYDRLPRSFDDYGDDLRMERAPAEGEVQLSERALLASIVSHDTIVAVTRESSGGWSRRTLHGNDMILNPASASDFALWLNLVGGSPACGGSPDTATNFNSAVSSLTSGAGTELDMDWRALARRLGIHRLARRRAVRHGDAVRLPDGTIVVHMASSLVAEVAIRHHTSRVAGERLVGAFSGDEYSPGNPPDGRIHAPICTKVTTSCGEGRDGLTGTSDHARLLPRLDRPPSEHVVCCAGARRRAVRNDEWA
jgi:hypothetical protein